MQRPSRISLAVGLSVGTLCAIFFVYSSPVSVSTNRLNVLRVPSLTRPHLNTHPARDPVTAHPSQPPLPYSSAVSVKPNRLNFLHNVHVPNLTRPHLNTNLARDPVTAHPSQPPLPDISLAHPRKREQLWTDPDSKENMLIRRVGYVDDRFDKPFITLIALQNEQTKRLNYYAKIVYKTKVLCLPLIYWSKFGHLDLKHNLPEIYAHYLLKTDGSILDETPLHVQVTSDRSCKTTTYLSDRIRVEWTKRETTKRVKYGVCLHKALFNIKDPQLLVDWIEIHKALGVEAITVSIQDVPETIANAVRPYIEEGLLELLDWKLNKVTRDYGQPAVLSECLYRNLYKVEFLGMYDLDEVVVPQSHASWGEMFEELSKVKNFNKFASFVFNGLGWHDGRKNEVIGQSEKLCAAARLPLYFTKTIRNKNADDHPKVIIRPALTTLVYTHSIGHFISGKALGQFQVPQNVATCHHYRVPDSPIHGPRFSDIMSRYKKQLLNGIRSTMCS